MPPLPQFTRLRAWHARLPPVIRTRTSRLFRALLPIMQCSIAAGVAWAIAKHGVGHGSPFFAPIAAVISLGTGLQARYRRSLELVVGVSIGIGVGDLLISWIGSGWWQLMLVVALAMAVSIFVDAGPIIPLQAASSAVLVATLIPPGSDGNLSRMVDALIGGVIGVTVAALVPAHPVLRARRDAAGIFVLLGEVLRETAEGLREPDLDLLTNALERARGSQALIDVMRADMAGGKEISALSPLYWVARERIRKLAAVADPLDNAVRNIRVLTRRALASAQAGEAIDVRLIGLVDQLSDVQSVLHAMMLADPGEKPDQADAARALRKVAVAAPSDLLPSPTMAETVILAQVRSTVVDLLMVAGLRRTSAIATLR